MNRFLILLVIGFTLLLSGCASEESYRAHLKNTQSLIEETALLAYQACQENQTRAVASSVIAQKMGKPFMTPDGVNRATNEDLESRWMKVELQLAGLTGPPESCRKAFEAIQRMREAYHKLHQLATNPAGPVEQYQYTTDVLYEAVISKGEEITEMFAGL